MFCNTQKLLLLFKDIVKTFFHMRTKNYPELNRLNECIENKGLKRGWLAKRSGLAYQTFCSIAANRCAPTVWEAMQIAEAVQEPVDKIFLKRNFSENVVGA